MKEKAGELIEKFYHPSSGMWYAKQSAITHCDLMIRELRNIDKDYDMETLFDPNHLEKTVVRYYIRLKEELEVIED